MFVDNGADSTATSTGGSSGHFVYDKDQMHAIAQKWEELGASYQQSVVDSRSMMGRGGPGSEYASKSHAFDANSSGRAYQDSLNDCSTYCFDQAAKYRKALGEVINADDESDKKRQHSTSPLDGGL